MDARRVLIVHSNRLLAQAVANLLGKEDDVIVVGITCDKDSAIRVIKESQPNVIVLNADDEILRDSDLGRLFKGGNPISKVLSLTFEDNELLVYSWRQISNATAQDLVVAVRERDQGDPPAMLDPSTSSSE